jgi:hypothetical protein
MKNSRFLVFAAAFLCAQNASAWRETGHFAVCEIAYRNLTPAAKKAVDEMMNGQEFPTSCTWPDMVRKTVSVHGQTVGLNYAIFFGSSDCGRSPRMEASTALAT